MRQLSARPHHTATGPLTGTKDLYKACESYHDTCAFKQQKRNQAAAPPPLLPRGWTRIHTMRSCALCTCGQRACVGTVGYFSLTVNGESFSDWYSRQGSVLRTQQLSIAGTCAVFFSQSGQMQACMELSYLGLPKHGAGRPWQRRRRCVRKPRHTAQV